MDDQSANTNNTSVSNKSEDHYRKLLESTASTYNELFHHDMNDCLLAVNDAMRGISDAYIPQHVARDVPKLAGCAMNAYNSLKTLMTANEIIERKEDGLRKHFPRDYVDNFENHKQRVVELDKNEYTIDELTPDIFKAISNGNSIMVCTMTRDDEGYMILHPSDVRNIRIKTYSRESNFERYECILTYADDKVILDNGSVLYSFLNEKLMSIFNIADKLYSKKCMTGVYGMYMCPSIAFDHSLQIEYDRLLDPVRFTVWSDAFKKAFPIKEFSDTGATIEGDLELGTVNILIEQTSDDVRDYLRKLSDFVVFAEDQVEDLTVRCDVAE